MAGESRVHLGPQNLLSNYKPTHRVQGKYYQGGGPEEKLCCIPGLIGVGELGLG